MIKLGNKSCLYEGNIEHRRFSPISHEFHYSVLYYFLDLDEIEEIFRFPLLFSFNFPGILSFWRKDYLGHRDMPLKESVKHIVLRDLGVELDGPIKLLTNISYFGFCFNPVSFYYCYDKSGENLRFIVSEVTNTPWGEKHQKAVAFTEKDKTVIALPKVFHVSPFMPMSIDYTWVFNRPAEELYVLMQNRNSKEAPVVFDSTLKMRRLELNFSNIFTRFLKFPLVTFKTMLAIYYQALRLYPKTPFYSHPERSNND